MFKQGDIVEASFYANEDMDENNLIKKPMIVFDSSDTMFKCFSCDSEDSRTHYCFYDVNGSNYNRKIGELIKEDFDLKYNIFLEKLYKWKLDQQQKFLDTEEQIEWEIDPLQFDFLYEGSVNSQSRNSYISGTIGIVILKKDIFPFLRRFWAIEPVGDFCTKVIPKSIAVGKPSKLFIEK